MSGLRVRLEVLADPEALAARAAALVAARAAAAVAARGRFALALSGGSTPRRTYELLAAPPHREGLPWDRVELFFSDERCVPPGHPDSNYRMAGEALLSRVALRPGAVHRLEGEAAPAAAAAAYEAALRRALPPDDRGVPALDLALLGLGPDGHLASLFPGSEALEERERLVAAPLVARLGAHRLTLTFPALEAARELLFLVAGAEKAARVAEVLAGEAPALPAGRLRARGEVTWLLDAAAAARLPR